MLREWLIEYSNDVLSGEIVACKKEKQACRRFLKDLDKEGTDNFPYVFDEEKAMRFLNWMTLFKHTKGVLAGQNIVPTPIQIFIFSNIYGWIHQKTGLRRFKRAYWQVGRKSAKSQSLACVSSYESMALGENMSEVYIGATKSEQSKIVWNEIKAQVQGTDFFKNKYKIAYGKIEHLKTNSFITALSKDANKSGDGFNPQCAVIDEYHAHQTSEILDVLQSGMGARPQPLTMIITTAGFELSNPCYRVEYPYVSKIIDPESSIENDEYFVMINELDEGDDIKDERNWVKANPILCSYDEGIAYLRGELKAALDVPEKMRNFLTKNMNIWVNQRDGGYMDLSKWNACGIEKRDIKLPNIEGKETYISIDLSKKEDLTSVSFIVPQENDEFVVLGHSFIPEAKFHSKLKTDKVPYDVWERQGYLSTTDGEVVDYRYIQKYITDFVKEHNIIVKEVCYDNWNASQFANEMMDEGYPMVEVIQGMKTLAPPTKHFREIVYQKKIIHNDNPVINWAIGNAVVRMDHNENEMLDKRKSRDRIDPIASIIIGFSRAMNHNYNGETDFSELYQDEFLDSIGW
ncbi:terminase large subunit [Bacillus seohaeanensis]|uniref:Terminase large subunit n=1 Tax=Bacillus seohaeanensis TaxID=284580 RepID=A0ABW5RRA3_9BACI